MKTGGVPREPPMMMADIAAEPMFATAHGALTFAFNFSAEQYAQTPHAKLMGTSIGSGKGLVGMDGAGQAGMVLAEVKRLTGAAPYFIAARFAPRQIRCDCRKLCCSESRPSPEWWAATSEIALLALAQLPGRSSNYRLRRGIVKRYFGEHVNMTDLAKFAGVKRDTAAEHNALLLPWLRQQDGAAMHAATYALKSTGMVE